MLRLKMSRKLTKLDKINIVLSIVLGLTLGFLLFHPKELALFTYQEIGVGGTGSMLPVIQNNDLLMLEKLDEQEQIYLGQIYVYKNNETESIVHRLIWKYNSTHYIFKGDNNLVADKPISREQITYKVIGVKFG